MCTTTPSNGVWASGGTVDTPVLGTGLARGGSSSLFSPTKRDTMIDTITYGMIRSRKKGVLVVIGFSIHASLRNYHTLFSNAQVKNTIGIACVFLKYQPLHLCISFVYNCILAIVSIHTCNIKKGKCSHYVRHIK